MPRTLSGGHVLNTLFADRIKRVKDAEAEAKKEIDDYNKYMETEFAKFNKSVCGV